MSEAVQEQATQGIVVINTEMLGTNAVKVTVEGSGVEEVMSTAAKNAAIMGARQAGMFRAGISGQSGPYPVDAQGNDATLAVQPGMRYRNEFTLSGGLGV